MESQWKLENNIELLNAVNISSAQRVYSNVKTRLEGQELVHESGVKVELKSVPVTISFRRLAESLLTFNITVPKDKHIS